MSPGECTSFESIVLCFDYNHSLSAYRVAQTRRKAHRGTLIRKASVFIHMAAGQTRGLFSYLPPVLIVAYPFYCPYSFPVSLFPPFYRVPDFRLVTYPYLPFDCIPTLPRTYLDGQSSEFSSLSSFGCETDCSPYFGIPEFEGSRCLY